MLRLLPVLLLVAALPAEAQVAKRLFGAKPQPSGQAPAPLGSYATGCLAGGAELPETGPAWQAMRLSRNRNWGHPVTIAFIERLGTQVQQIGWPRLYIGDISQPRGGPMTSGHRSHQIGLDADIWLRRPSERLLSRVEREQIGSPRVVNRDRRTLNRQWTPSHHELVRAAARDRAVARIFVNAAIKRRMCRDEPAGDRAWLRKIRPWWGHDAHFHVRLHCPPGALGCENQAPIAPGDGCDETLDWWFTQEALNPKPQPGAKPRPRRELRLADLPSACRTVLVK